jgi:major membrane immunogen (membrane-anchored lipoprotein)
MKKITAAILLAMMLLALTACGAADTTIGSAMVVSMSGANAGEKDGKTQADVTSCTVELDKDGKIVTVLWDVVQCKGTVTAKGEVTVAESVTSKKDLKEGYNMKGASPIGKEWYEQNAYFCEYITGKTLTEAIAVATNPGETDVVTGCTIKTNGYMNLLEKLAK